MSGKILRLIVIIFSVILIPACVSSIPASTPTLVPFSELDLEDLIIQENDLPAGVTGAEIIHIEDNPYPADYYFEQMLEYQDFRQGYIRIWIYEDSVLAGERYLYFVDFFDEECTQSYQCVNEPQPVPGLGDASKLMAVDNIIGSDLYTLAFSRCHAVVEITFGVVIEGNDKLIDYARILDERLTPIVCR